MTLQQIEEQRANFAAQGIRLVGYKNSEARVAVETWYFEELCFASEPWDCSIPLLERYLETLKTAPEFAYAGPGTWASVATKEYGKFYGMWTMMVKGCQFWMNPFAEEGKVYFFPNCVTLKNIKFVEL